MNETVPFARTWMDLEIATLREISQTEKEEYLTLCRIWKGVLQMNLFIEQKPTHRLRERTCGCQRRRWRARIVREFGFAMYTLLCLKWMINKAPLHSTENCQCCEAAGTGGDLGENGHMDMYGWVPLWPHMACWCVVGTTWKISPNCFAGAAAAVSVLSDSTTP